MGTQRIGEERDRQRRIAKPAAPKIDARRETSFVLKLYKVTTGEANGVVGLTPAKSDGTVVGAEITAKVPPA